MKTATFVKMKRDDAPWHDMVFSLSEPRPVEVINGEVIYTNHILVMYSYYFGGSIVTIALPCDPSGETKSFIDDMLFQLYDEHNADGVLNKLGYVVDWGKSAQQSKGA